MSDPRTSLRRFILILLATVAVASTVRADDDDNLGQRIVRGRVYNLDRGEGVPGEEVFARLDARIAAAKARA